MTVKERIEFIVCKPMQIVKSTRGKYVMHVTDVLFESLETTNLPNTTFYNSHARETKFPSRALNYDPKSFSTILV